MELRHLTPFIMCFQLSMLNGFYGQEGQSLRAAINSATWTLSSPALSGFCTARPMPLQHGFASPVRRTYVVTPHVLYIPANCRRMSMQKLFIHAFKHECLSLKLDGQSLFKNAWAIIKDSAVTYPLFSTSDGESLGIWKRL